MNKVAMAKIYFCLNGNLKGVLWYPNGTVSCGGNVKFIIKGQRVYKETVEYEFIAPSLGELPTEVQESVHSITECHLTPLQWLTVPFIEFCLKDLWCT
jgi:hypothetical protein